MVNVYPISPISYSFIHIGKTAGTSIKLSLNKSSIKSIYHQKRPDLLTHANEKFFLVLRNPVDRIISAFNHCKLVAEFELNGLSPDELNIHNCPAPGRLRRKFKNERRHAYSPKFEKLLFSFRDENEWGEALALDCISKKKDMAIDLLKFPKDNIFKGIGWYLRNGEFVRKNSEKIVHVGSVENIEETYKFLSDHGLLRSGLLNLPSRRKNNHRPSLGLTKKIRNKFVELLLPTDYQALIALVEANKISVDHLQSYMQ